jgi:hypothetical protein
MVDLNAVLAGANLLVMGLLVYARLYMHGNAYVDETSYSLAILLCLQTLVALSVERRQRDPLVIVLALTTIFYYSFRIFTLGVYEFSVVFDRFPYSASDSNHALVFILIANIFIYFGLYLAKIRGEQRVDVNGWQAVASTRIIFLLAAAIAYAYVGASSQVNPDAPDSRFLSLLGLFLAPNFIILVSLSYFFLFRRTLSRAFSITITTLIALEMVVHTLSGSRSAILSIVMSSIFIGLAMAGCIRFRRTYLLLGAAMMPLIVVALVVSFAISTYNRGVKAVGAPFDLQKAFTSAMEAGSSVDVGLGLDLILQPIFARIGFFDFSAEIIAHREQYRSEMNLAAYGRSIVDNILTPGFDVYDQPKIGNALQFIYAQLGQPSKLLAGEIYQSDQLGVYGEFYALFGYACLPILLAGVYLIKRLYASLRSENPFILTMKRVVVLAVFEKLINSYGVDWTIGETIPLVVTIYLYTMFFSIRRRGVIGHAQPGLPDGSKPLTSLPAAGA